MALMTNKTHSALYDLQCAASCLPAYLHQFVRDSIRGIYRTAEGFESRKQLQQHIDTLTTLVTNEINRRS